MSDEQILPGAYRCPFCGRKALFAVQKDLIDDSFVTCSGLLECGMRGPVRRTDEDAIKAWNRRAGIR
jgi:Lar family restriction alleviation protein